MTNGTRHDPCIPRHWAMGCPAWTLTRTSHNRVVYKIRPNIDVASISGVLHLVWPLAQSLSSMVVPTRSQNSSWHSLWDLRGTQAPQLRQSNNTLGGSFTISCVGLQTITSTTSNTHSDPYTPGRMTAIIAIKPLWPTINDGSLTVF